MLGSNSIASPPRRASALEASQVTNESLASLQSLIRGGAHTWLNNLLHDQSKDRHRTSLQSRRSTVARLRSGKQSSQTAVSTSTWQSLATSSPSTQWGTVTPTRLLVGRSRATRRLPKSPGLQSRSNPAQHRSVFMGSIADTRFRTRASRHRHVEDSFSTIGGRSNHSSDLLASRCRALSDRKKLGGWSDEK